MSDNKSLPRPLPGGVLRSRFESCPFVRFRSLLACRIGVWAKTIFFFLLYRRGRLCLFPLTVFGQERDGHAIRGKGAEGKGAEGGVWIT